MDHDATHTHSGLTPDLLVAQELLARGDTIDWSMLAEAYLPTRAPLDCERQWTQAPSSHGATSARVAAA